MPTRKPHWLSQKDCGLIIGLIHHGDKIHLSEEEKKRLSDEVFRHLYSRPRRRISFLQEWVYPEIHRLVNGVASWQVPLGKRFRKRAASNMVARVLGYHSGETLRTGYLKWKSNRTPQELQALCILDEPHELRELREQRRRHGRRKHHAQPKGLIRKISTW
jgi:hypothetical protein